jgi:fumarylacetoacetase
MISKMEPNGVESDATIWNPHPMIDATHDPRRESFVESANHDPDFPIQNLPLGIFSPPGEAPRGGVAIGDEIFDLKAAAEANLFSGLAADAARAASGALLNPLFAKEARVRQALRAQVSDLLSHDGLRRARVESVRARVLHKADDCVLHLPARIGDYTDFYAGIHHATNTGRMMRPDSPLLPNYRYVPVGYHGRVSSIGIGGTVRRPSGQRKPAAEIVPAFGPCRSLDYELELGAWIGPGNALGEPISIAQAGSHIVGLCLLNDWSARDIQAWEYQPLGPFLAKSFATTISPWVVTSEALAPFRIAQAPRPESHPRPLDYLLDAHDQAAGAFDIELDVSLLTPGLREKGASAHQLGRSNARHLYWTLAQLVAHHASAGCNMQPGDLIGSGTISAPTPDGLGSLLELSKGGREPIILPSGETRRFLEDGDEVIMRAHCRREGFVTIGFGECRGRVVPAL